MYRYSNGKISPSDFKRPVGMNLKESNRWVKKAQTISPSPVPLYGEKWVIPVEFGAKLDISVVDGWTRLESCSFYAYNEAGNLREMAERFRLLRYLPIQ